MKTSIILPVIRPKKAERCVKMIKSNAGIPKSDYEIITEIDIDRIGCPKMVERLAKRAKFETIMFLGDDALPGANFLKYAQDDMKTFVGEWGLVGLNDTTGRVGLATHWLAHKKLLEHLDGQFFHTGYKHCCCDVELTERCNEIGRFIYSYKSCVYHDHPIFRGEPITDPDYVRVYSDEYLKHDRDLLSKRRNNGWK